MSEANDSLLSLVGKPIVSSLFIIGHGGIPMLARRYKGELLETKGILISGFISAIDMYAKAIMDQHIMDIGFAGARMFYLRINDATMVAAVSLRSFPKEDHGTLLVHVHDTMMYLRAAFELVRTTTDSMEGNTEVLDIAKSFDGTADSIILEQTVQYNLAIDEDWDFDLDETTEPHATYMPDDFATTEEVVQASNIGASSSSSD